MLGVVESGQLCRTGTGQSAGGECGQLGKSERPAHSGPSQRCLCLQRESRSFPAGTGGHLSVGVPEPVQMSSPPGGGPLQLFSQTLAA